VRCSAFRRCEISKELDKLIDDSVVYNSGKFSDFGTHSQHGLDSNSSNIAFVWSKFPCAVEDVEPFQGDFYAIASQVIFYTDFCENFGKSMVNDRI